MVSERQLGQPQPAWNPDQVPPAVIDDTAARRAWDEARLADTRVLWFDAARPSATPAGPGIAAAPGLAHATPAPIPGTWLGADAPELAQVLPALPASVRAHAGLVRLADGTLVAIRRRIDLVRVVVGVFRGWDGRTEPLIAWREALRLAWEAPNFDTLGMALSQEKGAAFDLAARNLAAVRALDPENPWPRYYLGRVEAARGDHDLAMQLLARVAQEAAPAAIVARLRAERDDEWAPLRARPDYQALMAELLAAPPSDPATFVPYLVRFRRSLFRLDDALTPGGPAREAVYRFLEARTLDTPEVEGMTARWPTPSGPAALTLARADAPGGARGSRLVVTAIADPPGVSPPTVVR